MSIPKRRLEGGWWEDGKRKGVSNVLDIGGAPSFWLFLTTGMCSVCALWTCVYSWTSWTSQTCFGLPHFGLQCCRIGSACSRLHSHRYPIIAQTRSTELCCIAICAHDCVILLC
jgi:hypothetical protein